jgi:hypothetical protein
MGDFLSEFLASLDRALERPVDRPVHPAAMETDALLSECELTRGRADGPGGQHRHKVQTLVELRHRPTGVLAQAGERRSAEENKRVAVRRLRLELAVRHRVGVPAGDVRSAMWRERTRGGKVACNERHADYPAMLAEAMDVLAACGWEPSTAATRLSVTATQLVKLVGKHAPALAEVNRQRAGRGLHALKGR